MSISASTSARARSGPRANAQRQAYSAKHYHQPSDEFQEDWDWSGVEDVARVGLTLGINAANTPMLFTWRANDEFLPARQASLGK